MKNNSVRLLSFIIQVFSGILFLFLFAFVLFLIITPYYELIEIIVATMGIEDKRDVFMSRIFPREKLLVIRMLGVGFVLLFAFLGFKFFRKINMLAERLIGFSRQSVRIVLSGIRSFKSLGVFEKSVFILFFLALIFFRWKHLFIYPLTNDELFTWLHFVHPGFLAAATYYPGPNNHIFYSICCNVVDLFTDNAWLTLRLPAFIAGLLSVLIFFLYFLKRKSFHFAFLATLFYSVYSNIFYYSIHGRGYVFIYLFFILFMISVIEILRGSKESFWKWLFVSSTVLGFYTIPIFLYPFLSLVSFASVILLYRKQYLLFQKILQWSVVSGIITFVLYLPILIVSGFSAVTGNSFVKSLDSEFFFSGLPAYLETLTNYWWDSEYGLFFTLTLLFVGLLVLLVKGYKQWILLTLFCFLIPLCVLLVQQVHPFVRIWDYLLIIFSLLIAFSADALLGFIKSARIKDALLVVIFALCGYYLYHTIHFFVSRGFPYYSSLKRTVESAILQQGETAYIGEETYLLYFRYYAIEKQRDIHIQTSPQDSSLPDLVILPADRTFPYPNATYELLEDNGFVRLWIKQQEK